MTESPVTGISMDRVAGMTVPTKPTPLEFDIEDDDEIHIQLPHPTNYLVFDCDIEVLFSFEENGTSSSSGVNGLGKRYHCRGSLPFLIRDKITDVYIKNRFTGETGTIFLLLGS